MPKFICSLSYIIVDDTADSICKLGPGKTLAKLDIKNEFCLLPYIP